MALPEDWTAQLLTAVNKIKAANPAEVLFGLSLPDSWKGSLREAWVSGELRKMAKVKAITFCGDTIEGFAKGAEPVAKPAKTKGK